MEDRTKYLGGSEVAAVLGKSRWSTPLEVWAIKTGQIEPEERDALHLWLGNELEDVVAKRFTKETGKKVQRVNETLFHPKYSFLGANVDRRVVGEDAILECKTASAWKSKEWDGEEIPMEYILQCFHYLMVTGKQRCYLAVLIGNQDFKWKVIERDAALQADMMKKEVAFWNDFVITGIMPTLITKNDKDILDVLFPQAEEEKEVSLPDDANLLIEHLEAFEKDKKNLEGLIEEHNNELKAMIKEGERGVTSLYTVGWKNSKWSGLDEKAMKIEIPDVYEKYYRSRPTRRFTYKPIKENTNGKSSGS